MPVQKASYPAITLLTLYLPLLTCIVPLFHLCIKLLFGFANLTMSLVYPDKYTVHSLLKNYDLTFFSIQKFQMAQQIWFIFMKCIVFWDAVSSETVVYNVFVFTVDVKFPIVT